MKTDSDMAPGVTREEFQKNQAFGIVVNAELAIRSTDSNNVLRPYKTMDSVAAALVTALGGDEIKVMSADDRKLLTQSVAQSATLYTSPQEIAEQAVNSFKMGGREISDYPTPTARRSMPEIVAAEQKRVDRVMNGMAEDGVAYTPKESLAKREEFTNLSVVSALVATDIPKRKDGAAIAEAIEKQLQKKDVVGIADMSPESQQALREAIAKEGNNKKLGIFERSPEAIAQNVVKAFMKDQQLGKDVSITKAAVALSPRYMEALDMQWNKGMQQAFAPEIKHMRAQDAKEARVSALQGMGNSGALDVSAIRGVESHARTLAASGVVTASPPASMDTERTAPSPLTGKGMGNSGMLEGAISGLAGSGANRDGVAVPIPAGVNSARPSSPGRGGG